jgi:hypothetical protein
MVHTTGLIGESPLDTEVIPSLTREVTAPMTQVAEASLQCASITYKGTAVVEAYPPDRRFEVMA